REACPQTNRRSLSKPSDKSNSQSILSVVPSAISLTTSPRSTVTIGEHDEHNGTRKFGRVPRRSRKAHGHAHAVRADDEPRLVAQSARPESSAPAFARVQSHGPGARIRGGIQETRSGCHQAGTPG